MIKKVGLFLTILCVIFFNTSLYAAAERLPGDRWKEDLSAAIDRAREEHRELHLVLGAWPTEDHIRTLIAKETPETAPIRVYFAIPWYMHTIPPEDQMPYSTVDAPFIWDDFNSDKIWEDIKRILEEKRGGFNKIYFDWSTVYFASWKFNPTTCIILSTLTHGGSLYVPTPNLKFQEISARTQKLITNYRNKFRSGYNMRSIPLLGYVDQEYFLTQARLSYWGVVIGSACPEVGEISLEEINNEAGALYPLNNDNWRGRKREGEWVYSEKPQPEKFLVFTRP